MAGDPCWQNFDRRKRKSGEGRRPGAFACWRGHRIVALGRSKRSDGWSDALSIGGRAFACFQGGEIWAAEVRETSDEE